MSTRSGLVFRVETTMAEKEAVSMSDILRLLVETQQRQVEAEQRREEERRQEQRREEERRQEQRREEERRQEQRREEGERIRREESERQLELISKLVQRTEVRTRRGPSEKDVQLVRLTEKDDIETYLTTFERVMEAYEIDKSRWAFKLAPYLSGKAQQAYASLSAEEAAQYESVKEAVFHRAKELHDTISKDEAMMVTTRYGARKRRELQEKLQEQGQEMEMEKQARSEAEAGTQNQDDAEKPKQATELEAVLEGAKTEKQDKVPEDPWKDGLDDELLEGGRVRRRMTKAQKRQERRKFWQQGKGNQDLNFGAAELRQLQHTDESLAEIRQLVKDGHPGFVEKDSLIYRVKGHLGRCRTTKRLLQRFYWPNIYQDVANLCRNCARCQKAHNRRAQPVPLVPLPIMSEPFSRIAMDIVGPLPRSSKGHKYILVICDYATRYPEAVPLRTCDAEAVAEELGKLFSRVGIPREILTDQGTNFTSQLLAELYRLLNVHSIRTTPYHPQTDGLVERFSQTLKAMLRRTVTEEGKDWDRLLPYLLFAYREVPQASTGFSPFELLYGRAVRGPLDVIKATWKADDRSNESVVSYVLCIQDRLTKMAELVKDNLEKAQETQKKWYDLNAREHSFELREKVLVLLPTSTNKLLAQWQGPYEVVKKINKVIYQVEMLNKRKRLRNFHINMLRKWHEPLATSYWVEDVGGNEDLHLWNEEEEKSYEIADQLTDEQRVELRHLLEQYKDTLQDKPGRTLAAEHVIDTGTAKPVKLPPYRLPYAYRDQVQKELKEMVKDGIATTSNSEWAAPIVLVTKKDGGIRFCVDYRRLNAVSAADCYPMPRVDELIDRLGTAKYISTLDLSRGYWQVPMSAESRKKTSFVTPFGQFEFNVMPFGLHGAPSTFQRMMDQVLQGLETWSAAYIDDVVVQGATWSEHITALAAVLKRLQEAGLTAKPSKCHFGMDECTYLGHIVGNGHVRPEKGKVAAVEAFPVPKTKKDVRAFLGLTGYYRKFIPEYATIAAPLTELTKKEQPNCLAWSSGCADAFEALKRHLCTSPVLKCPNFERPFVLQTDASDWGVGAVLSQKDDDDNEHPVAYFSKKLLPRERRYSTIEKECLAIKLATHAFRVYLLGKPFTVQTDHHALEWLDRLKEDNARLTRWSLALQPYQFTVKYRPGKLNGNADALSRQASLSPEEGHVFASPAASDATAAAVQPVTPISSPSSTSAEEIVGVEVEAEDGHANGASDLFVLEQVNARGMGITTTINKRNADGWTALMKASEAGQVEGVKVLLDRGAEVSMKDKTPLPTPSYHPYDVDAHPVHGKVYPVHGKDGRTALMKASEAGQVECVMVLLDRGAEVNMQDKLGKTALMKASEAGQVECVKVLLDRGAEVNMQDEWGQTALMIAYDRRHMKCVKMLVDKGAQVNIQATLWGWTALVWDSKAGQVERVKLLLNAGVQVNVQNKLGETLLMKASVAGQVECVKVLLDRGAEVNMQDQCVVTVSVLLDSVFIE
eukprot:Em0003g85a